MVVKTWKMAFAIGVGTFAPCSRRRLAGVLALRPNCECCDRDLPPESLEAMICTYECTFCADCVADRLPHGLCPNCGGELVRRPIRPAGGLATHPASTERVLKPHPGCGQ
jgi:hypothetical protein